MTDAAQDTTEETTGTDVIQIPHKDQISAWFSEPGKIETQIAAVEEAVRNTVTDISTAAGRKAVKKLASDISRSKTAIDGAGKALNDERNRLNKEVNTQRNIATARLDALRDEVKAPVEAWEAEQAERKRQFLLRLDVFDLERATSNDDTATIKGIIDQITATPIDDSWKEYEAEAKTQKAAALVKYEADLAIAKVREDQAAELEKLRADAAKRAAEDAEREEAAKAEKVKAAAAEAEKQAKADADAAEARHAAAEAEAAEARLDEYVDGLIGTIQSVALGFIGGEPQPYGILEYELETKVPQEKSYVGEKRWPRVEAARVKAIEDLKKVKATQIERQDAERAEADAAAAQAERDRIAAEKKAEDEAAKARAADKKHRQKIRTEIVDCITKAAPGNWEDLVDMMIVGEIKHVKVAI